MWAGRTGRTGVKPWKYPTYLEGKTPVGLASPPAPIEYPLMPDPQQALTRGITQSGNLRGITVQPPKKMNDWYHAFSDALIANPGIRQRDLAIQFGVSEAWLSLVKSSDSFREFHGQRRELISERINSTMGEKLGALGEIAVDEITERIERDRDNLELEELQGVAKLALGALGFGNRAPVVQVNNRVDNSRNTVTVVDMEALQRGREHLSKIREVNDRRIIDQRAEELPGEAEKRDLEVTESGPGEEPE